MLSSWCRRKLPGVRRVSRTMVDGVSQLFGQSSVDKFLFGGEVRASTELRADLAPCNLGRLACQLLGELDDWANLIFEGPSQLALSRFDPPARSTPRARVAQ
jgi:hypothetical protein